MEPMRVKINTNIDSNKVAILIAGETCEVVKESLNCYLVKNDSPMREFGDPETIWVWKTDCVVEMTF